MVTRPQHRPQQASPSPPTPQPVTRPPPQPETPPPRHAPTGDTTARHAPTRDTTAPPRPNRRHRRPQDPTAAATCAHRRGCGPKLSPPPHPASHALASCLCALPPYLPRAAASPPCAAAFFHCGDALPLPGVAGKTPAAGSSVTADLTSAIFIVFPEVQI
ncbi:hypothetical protein ACQJBY_032826 [Aegilops geniculata]